ncbi:MAG TPA: ABC transporter permease [Pyrinomonadaceae bacterium]|nr:ABC transporter permease [Pyrinomonadaceae bacterium]
MLTLWQDLRFAARVLRTNPGFTAVAVLALALGVGANTTIFSAVNALLLRPFSYPNTDRVVMVWERGVDGSFQRGSVSPANYAEWGAQTTAFEQLAAYHPQFFNLTEGDQPERLAGVRVTPNLFSVLGVAAERGRTFTPEEGEAGREQVALVKHTLWQRRFGSDPDIVGKTVRLDGKSYTVVGVLPRDFDFPWASSELWVPVAFDAKERQNRFSHYLQVAGLLKPGATPEQAHAEVSAVAERLRALYPDSNAGRTAFVETLTASFTRGSRMHLTIMLFVVSFVLLLACANVANLLLVRGAARQRELAVRAAVGASRARLVRQLLTESLLLALLGGALGLLLSVWGIDFISHGLPPTFTQFIPGWKNLRIDTAVLGFTLAASVVAGVVFGTLPALQATRVNLNESLKEGGKSGAGGGFRRNRARSLLVVFEVALSLVLLACAGLTIRSFAGMLTADLGLRPDGVLTMEMSLPRAAYPEKSQRAEFYEQLVARVRALPGVSEAGVVNFLPMSRSGTSSSNFNIAGRPAFDKGREPYAEWRVVTPGYFEAAGTPLLAGRGFNERDDERAPRVCVVTESLARTYFPEGAVGQGLVVNEDEGPWEIVGVAADTKDEDFEEEPELGFYRPMRQDPWWAMSLVVRAESGDATALAAAVRGEVRALDRDLPVYNVRTLRDIVDETLSAHRLMVSMLGFFAFGALVLAAVGLYAVMSFSVTQRTHEIGIRMALGAQRGDVMRLVLWQGVVLTGVGLVAGLALARLVTRVMASILYGVSPNDPAVFGSVALVLGLTALLACYVPARRATRVDPMVALRHE